MRVTFKDGVRFREFTATLEYILHHLRRVEAPVSQIVVTSVNDGEHMTLSKHYTNEAVDVRAKNFPSEQEKRAYATRLRAALGPKFTVLYEYPGGVNQHFHIQSRKGSTFQGS